MSVVITGCLTGILLAVAIVVAWLLHSRSLLDRTLAVDVLGVLLLQALVVVAAGSGEGRFLNVAIVIALVSFIATVTAAGFVERRGIGDD
jgi:multicomponent Na+:H+ antiporter subunit F